MLLNTMKTLILLFVALPFRHSSGPGIWMFVRQEDGIKMYNRQSAQSKFNDIKIETDLPGNLTQIAAILLDVGKYTEWAYATKSAVVVKKISNDEFIYYSEIDVPWPANNRDFYAHCKATFDPASRSLKVTSVSIKDYLPEKKNIVRIPLSKGLWNITAVSDKMIHVEYILEFDPGGIVPAWLLNLFSTKGPMETFANLKHKMQLLNK